MYMASIRYAFHSPVAYQIHAMDSSIHPMYGMYSLNCNDYT